MAGEPTALIMAAGRGTRMRSSVPKVLHPVCGRSMIEWVVEAARAGGAERVVCVTRPGDGVREALPPEVEIAEQHEGEGTAAAVLAARRQIESAAALVVLSGDHPLVSPALVEGLLVTQARERAGSDAADHRPARPDRIRTHRAGARRLRRADRRDQVDRRRPDRGARHAGDQHRQLRVRSPPHCSAASTRSARPPASAT